MLEIVFEDENNRNLIVFAICSYYDIDVTNTFQTITDTNDCGSESYRLMSISVAPSL